MADILQTQYCSVFSNPNAKNKKVPLLEMPLNENGLEYIEFSIEDIKKSMRNTNTYSACPMNDIPPKVLKNCCDILSYLIFQIWTESFETSSLESS